jgi:hypothetical protein
MEAFCRPFVCFSVSVSFQATERAFEKMVLWRFLVVCRWMEAAGVNGRVRLVWNLFGYGDSCSNESCRN